MSSSHGFDPSLAKLSPTKVPAMMPTPKKSVEKLLGAGLKGKFSKVNSSFVGQWREGGNGFRNVWGKDRKLPSNMRFRLYDG